MKLRCQIETNGAAGVGHLRQKKRRQDRSAGQVATNSRHKQKKGRVGTAARVKYGVMSPAAGGAVGGGHIYTAVRASVGVETERAGYGSAVVEQAGDAPGERPGRGRGRQAKNRSAEVLTAKRGNLFVLMAVGSFVVVYVGM